MTLAPQIFLAAEKSRSYVVVPAKIEHVYALADNLRLNDKAEIEGTGGNAKRSLYRGFKNSILCQTAIVDGEVAAMWGLGINIASSPLSDIGRPWLLTAPEVESVPIAFIKEGRKAVARMLTIKPYLENYVLSSYIQAVRALKMMGFTVEEPHPIGVGGTAYSRFHIDRRLTGH